MTDESKRSWESVPLLGGVLRERRRLRLVEAYQLVRAGTDPRGAAEATKLDAGTASHFAHLMTTLIAAETEVRNLHEFAHTLSPEKTTDGFRESLSAADRACSQLRAAASDGRVEGDSTAINVLKTSIWVASNNASKLRRSLERTERGYGLLSELRQEALRLLAILEDESLPCMDWLRAHLRDVLEAERMLGAVVERYGFTTATVEQITVRLVSLRSLDVPSLVRTTRESLERVSKAYLPAIASLERALASYVDDDDPACDTQLELETEERDAVVPDLQTHDAFVLHERAPYEHLCELILRARRMLGDGDQNPAEGERLDEEELLELCLQRAREACEDPYLSMEAQYCLAVAAVAEARLLQEQARDVEVAGQVLADFRDLDLVVRSERMSHFRELVTHEYLPRTRARLRGLVQQLDASSAQRLLPEARSLSANLEALARRVASQRLCPFDIELMGSLMQRTEDVGRQAALEISAAVRAKAVARKLDEDISPNMRWLRVRMGSPGIGDPAVLSGTGLVERFDALSARVIEVDAQLATRQDRETLTAGEDALAALTADVQALKREVECVLMVHEQWERCGARSERLLVMADQPDMTEEEARRALETLYQARRHEQACVLLGRALVFPLGQALPESEWDAFEREYLASEPVGTPDPDFWNDDPHPRIGLLLDAWGYVIPIMLWFETRSETRALAFMGDYATSNAGRKKTLVEGKRLQPRVARRRARREKGSPAVVVSREPSVRIATEDPNAQRVAAVYAILDATISADLMWLQEKSRRGPLKEVYATEETALKTRYVAAYRHHDRVRILVEAAASQADSDALGRAEQEAAALATEAQALKRVAECILLMDAEWKRRKAKSERLIEARSGSSMTEQEAFQSLEHLYLARRYQQACVLLGRGLVLPTKAELTQAEWSALRFDLLRTHATWGFDRDWRPYDVKKRLSLLLAQWGYVVPDMLWYENRSEARALNHMRDFALGPGQGTAIIDGPALQAASVKALPTKKRHAASDTSLKPTPVAKASPSKGDITERKQASAKALLHSTISQGLSWIDGSSSEGPVEEVFATAATGIEERYGAMQERYDSVRRRMEAVESSRDARTWRQLEKDVASLDSDVRTLRREMECLHTLDEEWKRCAARNERVLDGGSVQGMTLGNARVALEQLYLARRYEQACVLLGAGLVFPSRSRVTLREWGALQDSYVGPSPLRDSEEDIHRYDARRRLSLLLSAWGYVIPCMLWYETRSATRALSHMSNYASGPGRQSSILAGTRLKVRSSRAMTATAQGDARRGLHLGGRVHHPAFGMCSVVGFPSEGRVELRLQNGEVKQFLIERLPLR